MEQEAAPETETAESKEKATKAIEDGKNVLKEHNEGE